MLHSNIHGTGAATVDYSDRLRREHNPGDVAILWLTQHDMHVTYLYLDIDWLTDIIFTFSNRTYVILYVYVP